MEADGERGSGWREERRKRHENAIIRDLRINEDIKPKTTTKAGTS